MCIKVEGEIFYQKLRINNQNVKYVVTHTPKEKSQTGSALNKLHGALEIRVTVQVRLYV